MGREGALALFKNLLITYLNLVRVVQVNDKNSDDPSFCFYRIYSNKRPTLNQRPPRISAHPKDGKS